MSENIPRPEYPRPQLVRADWQNLNGIWDFSLDLSDSGMDRKLYEQQITDKKILVPFCPESSLSGIEYKDFMSCVWYSRQFTIPVDWTGKHVRLHFGAVDYQATVWVNGIKAGGHKGGYTPFWFDITDMLKDGVNTVVVCAKDDVRSGKQPGGKQSGNYYSSGCSYTRTTGIWQTVWMEAVNDVCINGIRFTPNVANSSVEVALEASNPAEYADIEISFSDKKAAEYKLPFNGSIASATVKLSEAHLWTAGEGNLYDVKVSLYANGKNTDEITSYFGLRSVTWDKKGIKINGEYVYQRLVLDQGFYKDGIYTAPDDESLKKDIELSMAMGFNGARLHEKVFEPRFLYWADKMGYLCWGEHANWGLDVTTVDALKYFLPEWLEAIDRDYSHPSIVGWCPFNETWDKKTPNEINTTLTQQDNDVLYLVYKVTKEVDKSRPVIDTSGNFHVITDIFDIHLYEQDPEKFSELMANNGSDKPYINYAERQLGAYKGQPYFVSEYGGIGWTEDKSGWGYGKNPESREAFIERYTGLTNELLRNPKVCAFCYTQLYDVEQEQNGLYTYERTAKFEPEIIAAVNTQKASIEK